MIVISRSDLHYCCCCWGCSNNDIYCDKTELGMGSQSVPGAAAASTSQQTTRLYLVADKTIAFKKDKKEYIREYGYSLFYTQPPVELQTTKQKHQKKSVRARNTAKSYNACNDDITVLKRQIYLGRTHFVDAIEAELQALYSIHGACILPINHSILEGKKLVIVSREIYS